MSALSTFSDVLATARGAGWAPASEAGTTSFRATCPKCLTPQALQILPTPESAHPAGLWCRTCKRVPLATLTAAASAARGDAANEKRGRRVELMCANDVTPQEVEFLYPPWLPFGKIVAIDGAPGIGKTAAAIDWIARASRGARMPGADHACPPISIIIAGCEDGVADTIRPRLDAAAANLHNVHFLQVTDHGTFTVPHDVAALESLTEQSGARWVHVDSIMGTLAEDVRTNSDHDVRRALGALKDMAERLGVLITFIRHPRKAGAVSAVDAGGGSTAFAALSRVVLFCGFDPTDTTEDLNARRRVIALAKSNLGPIPRSRTFTIVAAENRQPRVVWGAETSVTADQLASAPMRLRSLNGDDSQGDTKQAAAESWLRELLTNGARLTHNDIWTRAEEHGFRWRTVERAATDIGVSKSRGKIGEPSVWSLPTVPPIPVAPNTPTTENDGGSGGTDEATLFPVAPSVAPSGGSGGTEALEHSDVPPIPVAPSARMQGNVGATDDDYWRVLLSDEAAIAAEPEVFP